MSRAKPQGCICCWNGCSDTTRCDMPKVWFYLFCYESPQPDLDVFKPKNFHKHRRDGVLCAQHAFMLERLLRPLPEGANQSVVIVSQRDMIRGTSGKPGKPSTAH